MMIGTIVCFGLSGLNTAVALCLPNNVSWLNWAAAVFCFGMGIMCTVSPRI